MFCSICLNKIQKHEDFVNNECCNNTFHTDCLEEWYKVKENCPLCRKNNEIITENIKKKLENFNTALLLVKILLKK